MAQAAGSGRASHLDKFRDPRGRTVLHEAAQHGPFAVLKALVEAGCDVNAKDGFGETPLMLAAAADQAASVQLLLDHSADMVAPCDEGLSAFHWAVQTGAVEAARVLLAAGANPDAACETDGVTPLHLAARRGHLGMVRMLLDAGADPGAIDGDNTTPLFNAAVNGRGPAVRLLLQAGAPVDKGEGGMYGTPLCAALAQEAPDPEVLRLLLAAGANVSEVPDLQEGTARLLAQLWKEDLYELQQVRQLTPALQEMIVKMACERRRLEGAQQRAGAGDGK